MNEQPLFTPPRLFTEVKFHRHTQRTISWLELFYDLVYVATLIQIGNFLSDNVTVEGFGQFLVMLAVVWWAWTGETFYQNRYVVDDFIHRVLVFTQIFAVASLAISISGAFGALYVQFTLAYIVARVMLILMYVRSMRAHPESSALSRGYITGFSLGVLVWFGSLFLPQEIHWIGWLVGLGVELAVPLVPRMRHLQRIVPIDQHHIAERFGIFTIIVLGEAFVKILDDAQGSLLTTNALIFSVGGLMVTYSLWWLYFTDTTDAVVDYLSRWKPLAWIYGHFPLAVGLVTFGVAAKKLFASAAAYPGQPLEPKYQILYTAALVFYLLAVAAVDYGTQTEGQSNTRIWLRLISAAVIGVIGFFVSGLDPVLFVYIAAGVMLVQVVYSVLQPVPALSATPVTVHET